MKTHALIDLFYPAGEASLADVSATARERGLDGVIYVASASEELPEPDEVAELNAGDGARIIPGYCITGPGYRFVVILPEWDDAPYDALEAAGDIELVVTGVTELGGAALAVCPHLGSDGEVLRHITRARNNGAGVVSMTACGTQLARDLDIEEATVAGRRILGGTGPGGDLDYLGRFSTLVPAAPDDLAAIIARLVEGYGVAVEQLNRKAAAPDGGAPHPKKKRRRRRRRRSKTQGDSERDDD